MVKCVSNELGYFEFAKDFVEKVVAQATTKHLHGSGMWPLATCKSYMINEHISPIASAFQDLCIRAISLMPKEWSLRFGKIMQQNVFANFLESHNLHNHACPSTSTYILERRKSGLILPALVCILYPRFFRTFLWISNHDYWLKDFALNKVWITIWSTWSINA